ncbi:MAG: bifunctional diguanylate cyclase/phosphodiesterase [Proteobacteria bacterium]|nr:bifunctional diguanylate cyclase/phosphodiesterase [Pseudomonadota bacterium]
MRVGTRARLGDIVIFVVLPSAVLFVAIAVVGFFLVARVREIGERQRLALFPERNPTPVIRLNADGVIAYANPSAFTMAAALGAASPMALLPNDLTVRLEKLRQSQGANLRWEYRVGAWLIDISVHRLEESAGFHIYLSDVTERREAEAQLEFQAFHDALTNLPNRRAFEKTVAMALEERRTGAVLLLSVDRFQAVVDTLGYAVADRVLCDIADRLALLTAGDPSTCCIHRFDGELFSALVPQFDAPNEFASFASRVAGEMAAPFVIHGREMFFSFSIGVAHFPQDGADVSELLRNADTALQSVKRRGGRGAVRYIEAMSTRALERLEVEHALRRAVERDELELHYQPQLDLASGRIVGVEALVRWRHPMKGMVSPADFIPIAEETGAIIEIGIWILATACAENRRWQEAGLPPLVMAVNISPRQFADPQLPQTVLQALESSGLAPQWLELEITEGAAMHDVDAAITVLHAFKAIGIGLSMDDFGTGYSSLSYLKRFPIDRLKVDQSFVRHMIDEPTDAAIVRSIIVLGHSLDLGVIAEGVETQAQLSLLTKFGCKQVQGYVFGRPRPAAEMRALLQEHLARPTHAS